MKKLIEKGAVVLYIIGLLSFPIYKVFLEKPLDIENVLDLLILVPVFLLYLVGWFFLYSPALVLLVFPFLMEEEDGATLRRGCVYPALLIASLLIIGVVYNYVKDESDQTHGIYTPVNNAEGKDPNTTIKVYICTGPHSQKYHNSPYCRGLNNCSASIKQIDKSTAIKRGRTACGICY